LSPVAAEASHERGGVLLSAKLYSHRETS
jgi:hypothetical protein